MLLEQVMPAFREGKKIRRAKWPSYAYMVNDYKEGKFFIRHDDRLSDQEKFSKVCGGLHATDWELFWTTNRSGRNPTGTQEGTRMMNRQEFEAAKADARDELLLSLAECLALVMTVENTDKDFERCNIAAGKLKQTAAILDLARQQPCDPDSHDGGGSCP